MAAQPDACVVWTILAQRRLDQVLARTGQPNPCGKGTIAMKESDALVAASFPGASSVVVQDVYVGFRPKPNELILVVEVAGVAEPGRYVVKLAHDPDRLRKELNAWNACKPAGLGRDVVLMALEPRYLPAADGQLLSLVYQDAQQSIGMDRTVALEEAFLAAVTSNNPTAASVAGVLAQVYHRLGHLLYRAARPWRPCDLVVLHEEGGQPGALDFRFNDRQWLEPALQRWDERPSARATRREALAAVGEGRDEDRFYDPVEYFRYVLDEVRAGSPVESFVPRMLRGKSHGDLHGRNVMVGLVGKDAHWPALFDYEDMAADNLVAWDFVKLETELKIRAYPEVFAALKAGAFPRRLWEFETALCRRTEHHRRHGLWPAAVGDTPTERLAALLLTLRSLAARYLGDEHGRAADWIDEYYFALACYGVYAALFENQTPREGLGAFVSAGTAAARLDYLRRARSGPAPGGAA